MAGKLDTAGLVEEANQVGEMQGLLESGDASGEVFRKQRKMHMIWLQSCGSPFVGLGIQIHAGMAVP